MSSLPANHQWTQGTVAASSSTTTLTAAGLDSIVVNISANTTLNINAGYVGELLRVEIKQDSTGTRIVTLGTTISVGTSIPSYTASTAANARDLLQFINIGTSHWALAAVNLGFTV